MSNRIPKKALVSYLINYLVFLVAILLISLLIFLFLYHRNKETINLYNQAFLQQSSRIIDERLNRVNRDVLRFTSDQELDNLLEADFQTPEGKLEAFRLSKILNAFVYENPYVRHCYIYLFNADLIITETGLYTRRQYFDLKISSDLSYNVWEQRLKKGSKNQSVETSLLDGGMYEALFHYRPVPNVPNKEPLAIFVEGIDEKILENLDRVGHRILPGELYIFNPREPLIFPSTHSYELTELEKIRKSLNEGANGITSSNHITAITSSQEADHYYLYRFPRASYYRNLSYYWYLVGTLLLLFLIAGLILSWFFALRRGGDIGNIIESLGIKDMDNSENPIDRINKAARSLVEREKEHEREKFFQADPLTINWGFMEDEGFSRNDSFCSLYLEMEDVGFASGETAGPLIMRNMEADMDRNTALFFTQGEFIFSIISLRAGIDDLPAYIRALSERLNQSYGIVLSGGVGSWQDGFKGIGVSLREARKASSYRKFSGPGRITSFGEVGTLHSTVIFPTELKQRLVMEVRAGRVERSAALLEQLFDECFPREGLFYEKAESFFHELKNTALSLANSLEGLSPGQRQSIKSSIFAIQDKAELKAYMDRLLEDICRNVRENRKSRLKKAEREELTTFVDENLNRAELDLNMASEYFSLSPYYFSACFKEEVGRNFKDYIRSKRISIAKDLLTQGKSMDETAREVGYSNETALYRNFKKETGHTPGFFKQLGSSEP